jgi:hypothetical protein
MNSNDWLDISTAPLNSYGKAFGPQILVWCSDTEMPVCAYYDCQGWPDNRGCFVKAETGREIENPSHWMAIARPWPKNAGDATP